jgi:putative transposase
MPEHVHLLLSEPRQATLAVAIKALKQGVSRRFVGEAKHFWYPRYYDFNVDDEETRIEKLRYLHRNPVKRGLCVKPEDWEWSSFCHYSTGVDGLVEIESEWTARKREKQSQLPHSSQHRA